MTSRALPVVGFLAATSIAVWACGGSTRSAPSAAASSGVDSAGVLVVTNEAPAWVDGEGWTVDSVPALALNPRRSGPHGEFSAVAAAARFADGRIVVADEATGELRLFGPDGRFLGIAWKPASDAGGTPGPSQVWAVPPDTIVALFEDDRVRWLSTAGAVLHEDSLAPPAGRSWDDVARLEDGSFVGTLGVAASQLDPSVGGVQRIPTSLLRVRPGTGGTERLAVLPGVEVFEQSMGGRTMLGIPPLARQTVVRADGALILVGTDEGMSYDLRRTDGSVVRRVSIEGYDLSGADTMAARIMDERLAEVSQPAVRELMRRALGQIPVPPLRPAYSDILVSPDGHVWVGKHRGPLIQAPPDAWELFDADGRWLGTVRTPSGFRMLEAGVDDVLGTVNGGREVDVLRIEKRDGG